MGVRRVRIYSCDGCGVTATVDESSLVRGWYTITMSSNRKVEKTLCSVCYGAVEWVAGFQGITRPPKVFKGRDGQYRLRKTDTEPMAEDYFVDLFDEDDDDEEGL